jgi:hypothetical protein
MGVVETAILYVSLSPDDPLVVTVYVPGGIVPGYPIGRVVVKGVRPRLS